MDPPKQCSLDRNSSPHHHVNTNNNNPPHHRCHHLRHRFRLKSNTVIGLFIGIAFLITTLNFFSALDFMWSSTYGLFSEKEKPPAPFVFNVTERACFTCDSDECDFPEMTCPFKHLHGYHHDTKKYTREHEKKSDEDSSNDDALVSRRRPTSEYLIHEHYDVPEALNRNVPVSSIISNNWIPPAVIASTSAEEKTLLSKEAGELPFTTLEQWRRYCSDDAPNNCYSSMCFLPPNKSNNNSSSQNNDNSKKNNKKNDNNHIAMPSGVGCQPSPFYRPPRRNQQGDDSKKLMNRKEDVDDQDAVEDAATIEWNRGRRNDEYTCKARRSQRGEYFVKNAKENAKNDPLFKFKKHTSWAFSKWYDWSGKCVRRGSKSETLELSGKHSKKDGLYHLKNVCLRPNGGIAGFFPLSRNGSASVLEPYEGTDDVAYVTHQHQQEMSWFLGNSKLHTRLKKPADCYLDTKVILFPVDWRNDNPGHCFYRTGYTLRSIEAAFGKDAMLGKDNVTVGYLRVAHSSKNPLMSDKSTNMKTTMMKYYYDILGTSWFSINGVPVNYSSYEKKNTPKSKILEELHGFIPQASDLENTYACFKDVVIAQNSRLTLKPKTAYKVGKGVGYGFVENQTETLANVEVPGAQTSFHIYGYRTARDAETLDILDNRLRECGQLPPRREMVRRKNPHVVFAVRSLFRRLSLQPFLIGHLAKEVGRRFGPGASLEVIEHSKLSFKEIIERFSDADVLLGMYGASLMWSLFMPPHAHIVMFNTWMQCFNHHAGVMRDAFTEYSGSALIRQQYHVTMYDQVLLDRYAAGLNYPGTEAIEQLDLLFAPTHVDLALDTVQCLMIQSLPQVLTLESTPCATVPKCCQFHTGHVSDASTRMFKSSLLWDDGVLPMLLHLRLLPKSSPYYSPRLAMLLRDDMARTTFAAATKPFAVPSYPKIDHDVKILVIEPCRYRSSVFAEMSFFRQAFQRVDTLYVAEYAMGEEFCRQHEDAEFERTVRDHSRATYHEGTKIRDYRWDKHFLKTCVYPCREFGPFDLTISDCLAERSGRFSERFAHCIVDDSFFERATAKFNSNTKFDGTPSLVKYTSEALHKKIINTAPLLSASVSAESDDHLLGAPPRKLSTGTFSKKKRSSCNSVLPCATEVYSSSTNGFFGTLLSFGFEGASCGSSEENERNQLNKLSILRILDTEKKLQQEDKREGQIGKSDESRLRHLFVTRGHKRCRIRPFHPAAGDQTDESNFAPLPSLSAQSGHSEFARSYPVNGDVRFSRVTGIEFGFNLMIQQSIRNLDAFNVSRNEYTDFTHESDFVKKQGGVRLFNELDHYGNAAPGYDLYI